MQRAMARQAEAERERRAKIINAEGEFQAAEKLADAAAIIGREPSALQLRYLQTLLEIGADQNSTIVFPLPLDLLKPFLDPRGAAAAGATARSRASGAHGRVDARSASCTSSRIAFFVGGQLRAGRRRRAGGAPTRRRDRHARASRAASGSAAWSRSPS